MFVSKKRLSATLHDRAVVQLLASPPPPAAVRSRSDCVEDERPGGLVPLVLVHDLLQLLANEATDRRSALRGDYPCPADQLALYLDRQVPLRHARLLHSHSRGPQDIAWMSCRAPSGP